jgi:carbonic anhydrase
MAQCSQQKNKKMKSKILKLALLLVLFVPIFAFSQAEDVKWDYPVKPGTKKWNELKTEKERINAVQIPDDVLDSMTTEDMVDACINFPLFGY